MSINITEKNGAIVYLRVIAMLGIFIDHAVVYMDIPLKAIIIQVTNSFVLLFLLISGFLYGNRQIDNFKLWYKKRCISILIPYWIFLFMYFFLDAINGNIHIDAILIFTLNMQGVLGVDNGPLSMWFMTLLFMCYLFIPVLQKLKVIILKSRKINILLIMVVIIVQLFLAFYSTITLDFGHPLSWYIMALFVFTFGYYVSESINEKGISRKTCINSCVMLAISLGIRLITNLVIDGTILYDKVISIYSNVILNITLFIIVYYIYSYATKSCRFDQMKINNRIIVYFDRISYCFYLIHCLVLSQVVRYINNQYIFFVVSLMFSVLLAQILKVCSGKIQNFLLNGEGN